MTTSTEDTQLVQDLVLNAHGNSVKVEEILQARPDLLNASAPWDETPLQAASHMGHRDIAEYVLELGAPLDVFAAAMLGRNDEVAHFLMERPEVVHEAGVHGMPILYFPAVSGQIESAELLVRAGADVNAGAGGNTALHGAAGFGQVEMVRWLLEHGADRAALNYEGKTPVETVKDGDANGIKELLG